MREFLIAAALEANRAESDPDPDANIPLAELKKAKWTSHSNRRLADKRARKYCLSMGIPLSRVDSMLGWKQAEHRLDMQEHYDEDNLLARMEEARITISLSA